MERDEWISKIEFENAVLQKKTFVKSTEKSL